MVAVLLACGPQPPVVVEQPVNQPLPPADVVAAMQVQAVLGHADVQHFVHLEPDAPLDVWAVDALSPGLEGRTFAGHPVVSVPREAARIQLTDREDLPGPGVRVRVAIPSEGVVGHVDLGLADYVWSVRGTELVEH